MPDDVTLGGAADTEKADRAFRRKALHRSWLCSGAGFAFLGRRQAALLTYIAVVGLLPMVTWVALRPSAASAWAVIGLFTAAAVLSVIEQFACKWATPRPAGPEFLVSGLPVAAVLFWTAIVGTLAVLYWGFGSLQLAGAGMSPTLEKGGRMLYSKRADPGRHQRGAVVVYGLSDSSAWGQPGWLTVGRILAVPGDRLAVRGGRYVVNGAPGPAVAVTEPHGPVVSVPSEPDAVTVPEGRFFVVQDDPANGYDSRVLSWVEGRNIVADRMYYLSGRGLLKSVE